MSFRIRPLCRRFISGRRGAVTIDWVVMTAAVIGLGLLVVAPIADSAADLIVTVSTAIKDAAVFPTSQGAPTLGN